MASFTVPCPKSSLFAAAPAGGANGGSPQPNHHNQKLPPGNAAASIIFRSDFKANRAPLISGSSSHFGFQASKRSQNVVRVSAQLNDVALEKSSNSAAAPEKEPEESAKISSSEKTIPDAASITAFMNQVAGLVELVDSRDIMELQLKQSDCEILIRKKEALPQPAAAPMIMMQSHAPQAMVPSQLPQQPQAAAPPVAVPAPSASPAALAPVKPKSSHPPLKCPMAGTFYRSPAPGVPPFVKVGDKVQKGQVICIIEAMKLMNEIEADQSGTIVDIIAEDGKPVSLDTPLLVIEP